MYKSCFNILKCSYIRGKTCNEENTLNVLKGKQKVLTS